MRRVVVLAVTAALLGTAAAGAGTARNAAAGPVPMRRVIVTLTERADFGGLPRARGARLRALEQALQSTADASQQPILDQLAAGRRAGTVSAVRPLWIVNAIAVTASDDVIAKLAARPDVASVHDDAITVHAAGDAGGGAAASNLTAIGAPGAWALGDRGQGVVVASLDTGVDMTIPELAAAWRGGSNSWFDPYGQHTAAPVDLSGHGTHTMSVMVAGGATGTALGVAPASRWIAARIFDDRGQATTSAIHLAFQWLLDPDHDPATTDAPQVVNNSWSMTAGCNLEFEPDITALRAARILPVFAAGNSGPGSPSDYSPANNPGALAVGATTAGDQIAADSSRGPTTCGGTAVTYPAVTAPGVDVPVLDPVGTTTATGTSLAAPHAAGALALLLSADPSLTAAEQETALRRSAADLGDPGPDNVFGDGRIDVPAAIASLGGDVAGPVVSGLSVTGTTLGATATDGLSAVTGAEWFDGADPGQGLATAALPADGAFDSPVEDVTADVGTLSPGTHTISVRARDSAGNWGAVQTVTVTVDSPGLFTDSFASGDLSAWSGRRGAGMLAVTPWAALDGDGYGLRAKVTGSAVTGVVDQSPAAESGYHARFSFDPSGTSTGGRAWVVFAGWDGGGRVFLLRYRTVVHRVFLRASAIGISGWESTRWTRVSDDVHVLDLTWQAGSPGSVTLAVDGTPAGSVGDLGNGERRLERVMLGPSGGLQPGARGVLLFDAFESDRGVG
ncbi:MAG TPA: S8 family serine peptidase [Gaiellales bacterium]|nr:S8 family serine peptidase [Gaiellales bacterium]